MNIFLNRKRFLVTGATGAVGRAVAGSLRESGAWVAGTYAQNESSAEELRRAGVVMLRADLGDRAQARGCVAQAIEQSGAGLDGLVYCAGNTRDRTLLKMTDAEWDDVQRVHLAGLVACVQTALPSMQLRKQGKIIAMGSLSGKVGRVGQANYSAAKAATTAFVKSLAREAGRFGISANVVCPGFIDSRMTRGAPPEAWERAKNESVLGAISSVEVVASFVTWMLSDACRGVTGQLFQLDSRIA